jgi:glycosyltransferase involved in cell wall biosynthesis
MDPARLSVIVTTHYRPHLLRRALTSIIDLGKDVQIVLCSDEGSIETRKVATEMLREGDIFVSVPGVPGPAATRNLGLTLATGEYVTFLDDDDTFDQQTTSLIPLFDGKSVHYTNYRKIFEAESAGERVELRRVEKNTASRAATNILVRSFIIVSAYFAPRKLASQMQFRTDLSSSEDWEFLIRLFKAAPFRHHPIVGSNWHILEKEDSRNKVSRRERVLNYKNIYKSHPSFDETMRMKRISWLKELGASEVGDVQ